MNVSKLFRLLLARVLCMGVVEAGSGGAVVEDDTPEPGAEGDDAGDTGADGDVDDEGAAADEAGAGEAAAADDGGEITVSLGEEVDATEDEDEKRAPEWVRELRKSNREKDRRIRELESKVAQSAPAPQAVIVGEKPTLERCDFDAEKFERELESWHERKREADEQKRQREQHAEQMQAQWQARDAAVRKAAESLKLPDYEDAVMAFEDLFPEMVHRGIVIGGPDDPKSSALLRYALGKNPKKAKELAAIKDPVKFAFAVAKLETQLKVTPRKSAPPPETTVRTTVAGGAEIVSQGRLKQLQEQAQKTGDYTAYFAAKRAASASRKAA